MNETAVYNRMSPGEEIRSIGGYYSVIEEGFLPLDDREVVFVLTGCELDSSCCGPGGTAEVVIPGFVVSREGENGEDAPDEIVVERIRNEADKKKVVEALREKYPSFIRIEFQ
ncbi:MAG: hypothetical protein JW738_00840 [Actinobacteria bacterium]|nr:hypothetical protein [Actinomycetota bacterium]